MIDMGESGKSEGGCNGFLVQQGCAIHKYTKKTIVSKNKYIGHKKSYFTEACLSFALLVLL